MLLTCIAVIAEGEAVTAPEGELHCKITDCALVKLAAPWSGIVALPLPAIFTAKGTDWSPAAGPLKTHVALESEPCTKIVAESKYWLAGRENASSVVGLLPSVNPVCVGQVI
jgi:hypothetical protein